MTEGKSNTNEPKRLNTLGCIEGIQEKMTQLNGIMHSLSASADKVDHKIIQATLWASINLVNEANELTEQLFNQLPRKD
ncbi:TPA: hypothetical protein NJ400_004483 [Vibrio parahaemolyticus]|nr:hypothetical protein [Vibrio parahaemolyticus]EGQ8464370.1 hypothetical protein [Vibrio parahaemolyticus]EGQ9405957.1 hypothetical protein [Vibrio parahaemolyticus]EGR0297568.1 hypothetical protein [Vibrio parahaemolyticus]EHM6955210.1 hypothetical protein [Vibrio parahaemolyticus]